MTEDRARRGKQTDLVVAKRVSAVYQLYIDGNQRPEMLAAVAKQQKEEAAEREAARAKGKKLPPFVWGDEPLPARTFRYYVAKAKQRLKNEGVQLLAPGQGDFIIGKNFARMDDVYQKALEEKRYEVCRKIIRDQLELCSLFGKITVSLSALDQQPDEEETDEDESAEPGQAERTLEENARETAALLNEARFRRGMKPLDLSPLQLLPTSTGTNGK